MKSTNSYFGIGLVAVGLGFVITVAFWGAVIYVAWHFIEKFW